MVPDSTPVAHPTPPGEAVPDARWPVTVVPVRRAAPRAGGTEREWRLGVLGAVGELFGSASPAEVVEGLGRILVEWLADWVLVVPLQSRRERSTVFLFATPAVLEEAFGGPAPPPDLELAEGGVLRHLPASDPFWTEGEDGLRFRIPGRTVEMPGGAVGGLTLGGARLRFGGFLVGRLPGRGEFGVEDRDLVERIATRVSAALESGELAREARRAARVRDAVVDLVVHDLATPLNSLDLVIGRMLATRTAEDTAAAVSRYGESARRAVSQMRSLLSDLGDLRDMEQGMFSADLSDQPVCDILAAAVARVEALALERGTTVRLTTDACPLRVLADPVRTIQCLANLLANAIQVTPPGEAVLLVPRRAGDRAEIDVVDRGPGIPRDRLPHLFDRYAWARGHDGRRWGLGLMIAQEIALAHGESLRVDTGVGRGTRITLSLALAPGND